MKKWSLRYIQQLSAQEKRITLATVVTIVRIILTPIIVYSMMTQQWGMAFSFFVVAAATDLFDGWCARMRNEQTFLGACLDPIADKFLLVSCFITLAFVQMPCGAVPVWFVLVLLAKECALLFGGLTLTFVYQQSIIMPSPLGKLTTAVQILCIMWLFICSFFNWVLVTGNWMMFALLLVLTIATLCDYSARALSMIAKLKVYHE